MDDDDLLARVQRRGRLPGRRESRRAVCGVLTALGDVLAARELDLLIAQLPDEIRGGLPRREHGGTPATCRAFLHRVSTILYVDTPDNAFLARVVFEQLNATLRVITPAALAQLVTADLRPLLRAGRPEPAGLVPVPAGVLIADTMAAFQRRLETVRFEQPQVSPLSG